MLKELVMVYLKDAEFFNFIRMSESIGNEAFMHCGTTDFSVVIPDSVTFIGGGAFVMSNISSVVIGNGITEIRASTFNIAVILNQLRLVIVLLIFRPMHFLVVVLRNIMIPVLLIFRLLILDKPHASKSYRSKTM